MARHDDWPTGWGQRYFIDAPVSGCVSCGCPFSGKHFLSCKELEEKGDKMDYTKGAQVFWDGKEAISLRQKIEVFGNEKKVGCWMSISNFKHKEMHESFNYTTDESHTPEKDFIYIGELEDIERVEKQAQYLRVYYLNEKNTSRRIEDLRKKYRDEIFLDGETASKTYSDYCPNKPLKFNGWDVKVKEDSPKRGVEIKIGCGMTFDRGAFEEIFVKNKKNLFNSNRWPEIEEIKRALG